MPSADCKLDLYYNEMLRKIIFPPNSDEDLFTPINKIDSYIKKTSPIFLTKVETYLQSSVYCNKYLKDHLRESLLDKYNEDTKNVLKALLRLEIICKGAKTVSSVVNNRLLNIKTNLHESINRKLINAKRYASAEYGIYSQREADAKFQATELKLINFRGAMLEVLASVESDINGMIDTCTKAGFICAFAKKYDTIKPQFEELKKNELTNLINLSNEKILEVNNGQLLYYPNTVLTQVSKFWDTDADPDDKTYEVTKRAKIPVRVEGKYATL